MEDERDSEESLEDVFELLGQVDSRKRAKTRPLKRARTENPSRSPPPSRPSVPRRVQSIEVGVPPPPSVENGHPTESSRSSYQPELRFPLGNAEEETPWKALLEGFLIPLLKKRYPGASLPPASNPGDRWLAVQTYGSRYRWPLLLAGDPPRTVEAFLYQSGMETRTAVANALKIPEDRLELRFFSHATGECRRIEDNMPLGHYADMFRTVSDSFVETNLSVLVVVNAEK